MKFSQFIAKWNWHTTLLKYLSYPFGWPHKWRSSQGHTWKKLTLPVLLIWSSQKCEFMTIFVFSRAKNLFLTLLLSYHAWMTSKIQINFRYRRYLKVLMILSYEFLNFLHSLCFQGWGIHFWYSYWATIFGDLENPGQLPVQEVLEGTDDCVLWIFEFSSLFMFSRVRNPFLIFLLSYHVSVTSKIQVNFRYRRYLKILLIVSYRFLKFSQYLCFPCRIVYFWYWYLASVLGCPRKSRSTSGTGGTDDSVLWIFEIPPVFMFSRSRNPLLSFLLSCFVWVTSKTSRTESWPRFSRSPKRGSSVGISAMNSLTL